MFGLFGWQGLQNTLHGACNNSITVSIPQRKDSRKTNSNTNKTIFPGHEYQTLAFTFKDIKLIVSDKRQKYSEAAWLRPSSFSWLWSKLETHRGLLPTWKSWRSLIQPWKALIIGGWWAVTSVGCSLVLFTGLNMVLSHTWDREPLLESEVLSFLSEGRKGIFQRLSWPRMSF